MKKTVAAIAAVLSVGLVQAQPGTGMPPYGYTPPMPGVMPMRRPAPAPREYPVDSPAALVQKGMNDLLARLQSGDMNAHSLETYLQEQVAPYFDFEYMAKSAAGNMYRYMSDEQKARMAQRIERQFLSTMVQRLVSYNNQDVRVISQRMNPDGRTGMVTTAISGPRGYPTRLDFRFYKARSGWKVFDVMANGQSAVIHYRRQFRQTMYMPSGRNQQLMRRPYRQPSSGN
jgi:phospholipid transport system substrate-binding protein